MSEYVSTWSLYKMVVAIACITGPGEPDPKEFVRAFPDNVPVLVRIGLDLEILDVKQLHWFESLDAEERLTHLRWTWKELFDAPYLWEVNGLPSMEMVRDALSLSRAYHHDLTRRAELDALHRNWLHQVMQENDRHYQVWALIGSAQNKNYGVTMRRQSLKSLRTIIGAEAYYSGRIPAAIPLWSIPYAE